VKKIETNQSHETFTLSLSPQFFCCLIYINLLDPFGYDFCADFSYSPKIQIVLPPVWVIGKEQVLSK